LAFILAAVTRPPRFKMPTPDSVRASESINTRRPVDALAIRFSRAKRSLNFHGKVEFDRLTIKKGHLCGPGEESLITFTPGQPFHRAASDPDTSDLVRG
jgi:hypothetical protein